MSEYRLTFPPGTARQGDDRADTYVRELKRGVPRERMTFVPTNMTADLALPERGDYGDNAVCGLACGYQLLVKLCQALGGVDEVKKLLPPEWRGDVRDQPLPRERAGWSMLALAPMPKVP